MNTLRERLFILVSLLLILAEGFSQSLDVTGNQWIGKTNSQQLQGRNNLYHLQQAQVLTRNFDWENSFLAYENAIAENPLSPNLLIRRAQFKALIGMETEAQADIDLAKRLHPYAIDIYGANTIGNIRNVMSYEPLESTETLDFDYRLGYYYDLLDELLLKEDELTEAVIELYEVVDLLKERDFAEAQNRNEKIIKKFPSFHYTYDLMGLVHLQQEEYEQAEKMFQKALSFENQYYLSWYNLGRLEQAKGNWGIAAEYFQSTTLYKPNLSKAYFDRALVLKKTGDWIGAIQNYNAVIELKGKDHVEALLNRGLTYKQMGELHDALMDLDAAIRLSPNKATLYKNRANIHLLNANYRHAIADYTQAIELESDLKEAWYNRALTHLIMLDNVSACHDLRESKDLGYPIPDEIEAYSCGE